MSQIRCKDVGILIQTSGTVIRSGLVNMQESEREYECAACKHRFMESSKAELGYQFELPRLCPSPSRWRGGGDEAVVGIRVCAGLCSCICVSVRLYVCVSACPPTAPSRAV